MVHALSLAAVLWAVWGSLAAGVGALAGRGAGGGPVAGGDPGGPPFPAGSRKRALLQGEVTPTGPTIVDFTFAAAPTAPVGDVYPALGAGFVVEVTVHFDQTIALDPAYPAELRLGLGGDPTITSATTYRSMACAGVPLVCSYTVQPGDSTWDVESGRYFPVWVEADSFSGQVTGLTGSPADLTHPGVIGHASLVLDALRWMRLGRGAAGDSPGDGFGAAVSLSAGGTRVAAGARYHGGAGPNAGRVRVLEWASQGSEVWAPLGADLEGGAAGDLFGHSVAASADGALLAVGAPGEGGGGRVHVFSWDGVGTWEAVAGLETTGAAGDSLGASISLSADGSRLAVGAPGGSYVATFARDPVAGGAWQEVDTILGDRSGDMFGASVSLSADGASLAVGAPGTGHVSVWAWAGSSLAPVGAPLGGPGFGASVSLSGDGARLAVGAPGDEFGSDGARRAKVAVFDRLETDGGEASYVELREVGSEGAAAGVSVALSHDGLSLAVGDVRADGTARVSLFVDNGAAWALGDAREGRHGHAVSVSALGGRVAAGSPVGTGDVVVFHRVSADPSEGNAPSAPVVIGASISSAPANGAFFTPGETLTVSLELSEDVYRPTACCSTPTIGVRVAGRTVLATYDWALGDPDSLAFVLQLEAGVEDVVGISVLADSLASLPEAEQTWAPLHSRHEPRPFQSLSFEGVAASQANTVVEAPPVDVARATAFVGALGDGLGSAVSSSADGARVAVGAPSAFGDGSVLVLERLGDWWTETGVLGPGGGAGRKLEEAGLPSGVRFGHSVSLSADGTRVAVGAPGANDGAGRAQVFEASGPSGEGSYEEWVQVGADISGGASEALGHGVSLSADGTRLAVGAPAEALSAGRVAVFDWDAGLGAWVPSGGDVSGDPEERLGLSVSLSADGARLAAGGGGGGGSVRVLELTEGGSWGPAGGALEASAGADLFGSSVALDAGGARLAAVERIGLTAQARSFEWDAVSASWRALGEAATCDMPDRGPPSMALSADGASLAVGAPSGGEGTGVACVFRWSDAQATWERRVADIRGAAGDAFGAAASFAADGSRLVVGAPSGSAAHFFADEDRSASVVEVKSWRQVGETIPGDVVNDYLGRSVYLSADGRRLVAGANLGDVGSLVDHGYAKVFELVDGEWAQLSDTLAGEDSKEQFGFSTRISGDGNRLIVGSRHKYSNNRGQVTTFRWDAAGRWERMGQPIDGKLSGESFGRATTLSSDGSRLAAGAYLNSSAGTQAGRVAAYEWDAAAGDWVQLGGDLIHPGPLNNDSTGSQFGIDVALSADGSRLAVGCRYCSPNGGTSSVSWTKYGAADVFAWNAEAGTWDPVGASLYGAGNNNQYGWYVSLSADGNRLAVCAFSGYVDVFEWDAAGGSWQQMGSRLASGTSGDGFGFSAELNADGTVLAISAKTDSEVASKAGRVDVFRWTTENGEDYSWEPVGRRLLGPGNNAQFGHTLSLSDDGDTLAVGALFSTQLGVSKAGSVEVFVAGPHNTLYRVVSGLGQDPVVQTTPTALIGVETLAPHPVGTVVTCRSGNPPLLPSFAVPITRGAGGLEAFQVPALSGYIASDVVITYTCAPTMPFGGWARGGWTPAAVSKFTVLAKASTFSVVAGTDLPRAVSGTIPADQALGEDPSGGGHAKVAALTAVPDFVRLVRADELTGMADCTEGQLQFCGAEAVRCVSSDTGVHPGFDAALPEGQVSVLVELPASSTNPAAGNAQVTFTCAAVADPESRWAAAGTVQRFVVEFERVTTNDSYEFAFSTSRRRGLSLTAGDVVGVGTSAINLTEKVAPGGGVKLKLKAGAATEDVVIDCVSSHPEVLSDDGVSDFVGSVSIPAGSTAEHPLLGLDGRDYSTSFLVPQNVAASTTVTVSCGPRPGAAGQWLNKIFIFDVNVAADAVATGQTAAGQFEVVAGTRSHRSDSLGLKIAEGTALSNTPPFAVASGGVEWDLAEADLGLLAVKVSAGLSGSRLRCASEFPDVLPTFTTGVLPAEAATLKDFVISPGNVALAADRDVRFECQLVTDGKRTAIPSMNDMFTFSLHVRKQRLRVLAGNWAFDAFTGKRLAAASDPLGPSATAATAAKQTVLMTAGSSLEPGDLALLQSTELTTGSVGVSCTWAGDPIPAFSVTGAATPVPLAAPATVAAQDDPSVLVTCAASQDVSPEHVKDVDMVQFRVLRRPRRFRAVGAERSLKADDFTSGDGLDLTFPVPAFAPGAAVPRLILSAESVADTDGVTLVADAAPPQATVPVVCASVPLAGSTAHTLIPQALAQGAGGGAPTAISFADPTTAVPLYLPASAPITVSEVTVRFSCHPDLPAGAPAERLDASGAAKDLAGEWLGSDRVVFEVVLRALRFRMLAGSYVYDAASGAKVAADTPLDTTDALTPTISAQRVYVTAGAGSESLVRILPLLTTRGDAYTSSPSVPATLLCESSAPDVMADVTFPVAAAFSSPVDVQIEGATGATPVAEDTPVTFHCRPDAQYGPAGHLTSWSPGDVFKVRVVVRKPRFVAIAGPDALRPDRTSLAAGTPLSRYPTDSNPLAVTENFEFEAGRQVRLTLSELTDTAFTLKIACTVESPSILLAVPPVGVELSFFPGTQGPVNIPMQTFNVGVDTPLVLECRPDPAEYAAVGVPAGGKVFMTDVALVSVSVMDNVPPENGLTASNTHTLTDRPEDSGPQSFDVKSVLGLADARELDSDISENGVVTFVTVCDAALGVVEWTDPSQGIFTYTPNPDAFGVDAVVFQVIDELGAQSPIGIINFALTPLPDPPRAVSQTLSVLDGELGRMRFSWISEGLAVDPDGIDETTGHTVTITKLPKIPGDLSVDAGDVVEWQTADLAACVPPSPPAANPCHPKKVKATTFVYNTALNSLTAYDGVDEIRFTVDDTKDGLASAEGTIALIVQRQGDNNVPPLADPIGITIAEEATEVPFMYPKGTDEVLSRAQLTYTFQSPRYGSLVIWCPEPESWANRDRPLVVSPPDTCPTTFGSRTKRPATTTLPGSQEPITTCDPACIATDTCTAADCLEAGGVLDARKPGSFVPSDEAGQAASRVPVLLYSPPANFFGDDLFSYRSRDAFGDSDLATVTVRVTNKADPPQLLCEPAATNSFLEGKGGALHGLAVLLSEGPARNWHHGGRDVLPCIGDTSTPDGQADAPGIAECGARAQPDFAQANNYDAFVDTVSRGIMEDLWALEAETSQADLVKSLQSLRANSVILSRQGAQVVCDKYRAFKAPMTAAGITSGDLKFATYLYNPDAGAEGIDLRYAIREVAVARDGASTAGPAAETTGLSFVRFSEDLESQIVENRTSLVDVYFPDNVANLGAWNQTGDLTRVRSVPLFLSYTAPDLKAGNTLQRFEWGYFNNAADLKLEEGATVDKVDGFVAMGTVDIYVSCAPGFKAIFGGSNDTSRELNLWACEACPAGTFNQAGVEDQTSCYPCPAGTSAPPGSTSCTPCQSGFYAPVDGSEECLQCPDSDMVTGGVGSRSLLDCRCPPGFFRPPWAANTCVQCDADKTLCLETNQPIPLPKREGIHVDPSTGLPYECLIVEACPKIADTSTVLNGDCAVGYRADAGTACDRCDVNFYKSGRGCKRCQDYTWAIVFVGLTLLVMLAPLMIKLAQKDVFASVNILVVFFQTTFVFADFRWEWPKILEDFFDYLSIFAFNIELMSPECFVGEFSSLHKIWMMNIVPLAIITVIAGCLPFMRWQARRDEAAAGKVTVTVMVDRMIGDGRARYNSKHNVYPRDKLRLWIKTVHRSSKLVVERKRGPIFGWSIAALLDVERDLVWRPAGTAQRSGLWCDSAPHSIQLALARESLAPEPGEDSAEPGVARRVIIVRGDGANQLWLELQAAADPGETEKVLSGMQAIQAMNTMKVKGGVLVNEAARERIDDLQKAVEAEKGAESQRERALMLRRDMAQGEGRADSIRRFAKRTEELFESKLRLEKEKARLMALRAELGAAVEDTVLYELAGRVKEKGEELNRLISAGLLILQLMFFVMLQTNLNYFDCARIEGGVSGDGLYWKKEPQTKCYDFGSLHGKMLPVVMAGLLLYAVGIPLLFGRIIFGNRELIARRMEIRAALATLRSDPGQVGHLRGTIEWSPAEQRVLDEAHRVLVLVQRAGFMFKRFKPEAWWYEMMVMFRKAVIALIFLLGTPLEQILVIMLLLLMSTCVVLLKAPYADNSLTAMETWALGGNMLIVLFGAIFYLDKFQESTTKKLGLASLVVLVIVSGVLILMMLQDAIPKMRVLARHAMFARMRGKRGSAYLIRAAARVIRGTVDARAPKRVLSARDRWQMVGALVRWIAVPPKKRLALQYATHLFPGFDDMKVHHTRDTLDHAVNHPWEIVSDWQAGLWAGLYNKLFAWKCLGVYPIRVRKGDYREVTPYAQFRRFVLSLRPQYPSRCPLGGNCKGTGRHPTAPRVPCATCGGTGQVARAQQHETFLGGRTPHSLRVTDWCPECLGEGGRVVEPCSARCDSVVQTDDLDAVLDSLATMWKALRNSERRKEARKRHLLAFMEADRHATVSYLLKTRGPQGGGSVILGLAGSATPKKQQRSARASILAAGGASRVLPGPAPAPGRVTSLGRRYTAFAATGPGGANSGEGWTPKKAQGLSAIPPADGSEIHAAGPTQKKTRFGVHASVAPAPSEETGTSQAEMQGKVLTWKVAASGDEEPLPSGDTPPTSQEEKKEKGLSRFWKGGRKVSSVERASTTFSAVSPLSEAKGLSETAPRHYDRILSGEVEGEADDASSGDEADEDTKDIKQKTKELSAPGKHNSVRRAFGELSPEETDEALGMALELLKEELARKEAERLERIPGASAREDSCGGVSEEVDGPCGEGRTVQRREDQSKTRSQFGFWLPTASFKDATREASRGSSLGNKKRSRLSSLLHQDATKHKSFKWREAGVIVPEQYRSKKHQRYVRDLAEMFVDWLEDMSECRAAWFFQSEQNNVFNPFRVESKNPLSRDFIAGDRFQTAIVRLADGRMSEAALEFIAFGGTDSWRLRHRLRDHEQDAHLEARDVFNHLLDEAETLLLTEGGPRGVRPSDLVDQAGRAEAPFNPFNPNDAVPQGPAGGRKGGAPILSVIEEGASAHPREDVGQASGGGSPRPSPRPGYHAEAMMLRALPLPGEGPGAGPVAESEEVAAQLEARIRALTERIETLEAEDSEWAEDSEGGDLAGGAGVRLSPAMQEELLDGGGGSGESLGEALCGTQQLLEDLPGGEGAEPASRQDSETARQAISAVAGQVTAAREAEPSGPSGAAGVPGVAAPLDERERAAASRLAQLNSRLELLAGGRPAPAAVPAPDDPAAPGASAGPATTDSRDSQTFSGASCGSQSPGGSGDEDERQRGHPVASNRATVQGGTGRGSPRPGSGDGRASPALGGAESARAADSGHAAAVAPAPEYERMTQSRKQHIAWLVRRPLYHRLGLWALGLVLGLLRVMALVGAAVRSRGGSGAVAPEMGDLCGDVPGGETPAARALLDAQRRLFWLHERRHALKMLKREASLHQEGRLGWRAWVRGAAASHARELKRRMLAIYAEVSAVCTADEDRGGWRKVQLVVAWGNLPLGIQLVGNEIRRAAAVKDEREAVHSAEQAPQLEEQLRKIDVQRSGAEATAEKMATALEDLSVRGHRRQTMTRGGHVRKVGWEELRRMKDALRRALEVVVELDEQEDAVRRQLNRLDARTAGKAQSAEDRRRHLMALLAGVWSGSLWAMWTRPLVAETWMQVDKGFVKKLRDQRKMRKEDREFAKLRTARTGRGLGTRGRSTGGGGVGGGVDMDTQTTLFGSIKALFQMGRW